uniref:Biogenesis of lysosome-related organelles complex 1 subunit 3 n=1 Tax=Angiostrongylus cantonensis TaxID=6313 RepID=A0A0K0D4N6_ANGCA
MPDLDADDDARILGVGSNAKALSLRSDSRAESVLNYSELEDDDTPLDQKHLNLVHEELEKLNIATDVINKLEVQLDAARVCFREIQTSWSEKLKELSKKYSSAIAKARPYYEAKIQVTSCSVLQKLSTKYPIISSKLKKDFVNLLKFEFIN